MTRLEIFAIRHRGGSAGAKADVPQRANRPFAECFRILGELEINVDMISQQMAQDGTCTVSFSCDDKQGRSADDRAGKSESL